MEIPCDGSAAELYSKLKAGVDRIRKSEYGRYLDEVEFLDKDHTAVAKGSGFSAKIQCKKSKIIVELNLGLLLKPIRGKIESVLKKQLSDALS